MAQYRQNRVAEEIRKHLDRLIREELRDQRITGTFSITRAEVARDLRYAKVFVSTLEEDKLDDLVKALNGAAGFLRHSLGGALTVRYTPELHFQADRNIAYGLHIAGVLKQVMGEQADKPEDERNQSETGS